jgi:hypothetical protein
MPRLPYQFAALLRRTPEIMARIIRRRRLRSQRAWAKNFKSDLGLYRSTYACGFAATQCGKALPYREGSSLDLGGSASLFRGVASERK